MALGWKTTTLKISQYFFHPPLDGSGAYLMVSSPLQQKKHSYVWPKLMILSTKSALHLGSNLHYSAFMSDLLTLSKPRLVHGLQFMVLIQLSSSMPARTAWLRTPVGDSTRCVQVGRTFHSSTHKTSKWR